MCPARDRCAGNARDEQDRDQSKLNASAVAIRAPPREGFYPVAPDKGENAEEAGQSGQRDLDSEQQNPVVPHALSPCRPHMPDLGDQREAPDLCCQGPFPFDAVGLGEPGRAYPMGSGLRSLR